MNCHFCEKDIDDGTIVKGKALCRMCFEKYNKLVFSEKTVRPKSPDIAAAEPLINASELTETPVTVATVVQKKTMQLPEPGDNTEVCNCPKCCGVKTMMRQTYGSGCITGKGTSTTTEKCYSCGYTNSETTDYD